MALASSLGSFPEWVLVIGILLSLATYVRGSRSSAITHLRNERDELDKECHRLTAENAALHATRDLGSIQAAMLDAIEQHEARAAERAGKVLTALDRHLTLTGMIADRLGTNHAS